MTTFRYLTAGQWGIRWARPPAGERTPDGETYVHHTAGGQMSTDAAQAFRLLNEYAITSKGYSALDYDLLVHYDPAADVCTIGEGRGPWMSAATKDRNEQGEAVCVLGYFHPGHQLSRRPHPAELEGVARAIVWGIENSWIARDTIILGHRDNPAHPGATGCPGDYLYEQLDTVRRRVDELLTPEVSVDRYILKPYAGAPKGSPWLLIVRTTDTVRYLNGIERDIERQDGTPELLEQPERYRYHYLEAFGIDNPWKDTNG